MDERSASILTGATLPALALALVTPFAAWPQEESPTTTAGPPPVFAPPPESPPPPVPAEPAPVTPLPSEAPVPAAAPDDASWVDASHRFLSRGFLWAVVGFDHFFADEREVDLPQTRSFFHWRNALSIRDDGKYAYVADVRAEAVMPNLDRRLDRLRLRFTFVSTSPEAIDPLIPPNLRAPDVSDRPHAGIVLSPFQSFQAQADIQTGALLLRPLGWYGRVRFRHVQPIGELLVARLALAGFWQTDIGFGTRQDLSLEHPVSPWLLFRVSNRSMVAQRSRGWEWSSEAALLTAAWPRTALSLSGAAFGATQVGPGVEVWRIQGRARHDVFRRWIFVEAAPEIAWTRIELGHRQRASAIILYLEILFDAATSRDILGVGPDPGAGDGRP